jgi:hypothetical protein
MRYVLCMLHVCMHVIYVMVCRHMDANKYVNSFVHAMQSYRCEGMPKKVFEAIK